MVKLTPPDNRYILFRYRRNGTEIVVGASLASLIAVIVLAFLKPEIFAIPALITTLWRWIRGG
jgi:hypothetical protein